MVWVWVWPLVQQVFVPLSQTDLLFCKACKGWVSGVRQMAFLQVFTQLLVVYFCCMQLVLVLACSVRLALTFIVVFTQELEAYFDCMLLVLALVLLAAPQVLTFILLPLLDLFV